MKIDKNDKILKAAALAYHRYPMAGKMETVPTKPFSTPADLALAYSPGVAFPCLEIAADPDAVYKYTGRGNTVAVITNGTAVLGLGDIGALAAKPVMEGKSMLFKIFAGLDSVDVEIDEKDPARIVEIVKALSPTYGGINLEDIKAPECFEIEQGLVEQCDIPIMHDDQHGTAVIVGAATINGALIQHRKLGEIKLVVNGAGAAAMACTRLLVSLGIDRDNIVMCDSRGVIRRDRPGLSDAKAEFATTRTDLTTLADAMKGADMFLGLSVADVLTPEMVQTMASRPIVFALANPNPEIARDAALEAMPDMVYATGRSDYPNQINNVLGFPYIFRGALDCRASRINESMKLAAARAISALARTAVPEEVKDLYPDETLEFGRNYILPKPFDRRLLAMVPPAVVEAAQSSGVARTHIGDLEDYGDRLRRYIEDTDRNIRQFIQTAKAI